MSTQLIPAARTLVRAGWRFEERCPMSEDETIYVLVRDGQRIEARVYKHGGIDVRIDGLSASDCAVLAAALTGGDAR